MTYEAYAFPEIVEPDCRCGMGGQCDRHYILTELERAAVKVLHEARDLDVGREGGPLYAGDAEEIVLTLRRAGFAIQRRPVVVTVVVNPAETAQDPS